MEGVNTEKHKQKKYLEVKKKANRAIYKGKSTLEKERLGNLMWSDDQKCDVFKTTKRMVKTNQDITGEQYIRNYDGVLAAS